MSNLLKRYRTLPSVPVGDIIMPKKKCHSDSLRRGASNSSQNSSLPGPSPVTQRRDGSVSIAVQAKPGAKHNNITEIADEGVGIQIAAPPVDGAANSELLRYLSSVLGVRKSDLSFDRGAKSRSKSISVAGGVLTTEEVLRKLRAACEDG